MSLTTCTRRIEFDAAHRVCEHESKCKYLHGHRYVLEVTFIAQELDALGRVVDFGIIKQEVGGWINNHFDHTAILAEQDKELGEFLENYSKQKVYYLPKNPTAENIALHLYYDIIPHLIAKSGLQLSRVKLYETPNCYVEVLDE